MLIILLQFVLSDTQVLTFLYDVNYLDMIWETEMNIRQNQQQQKMKKSTYTHTLNEYYNNKTVQNYPGKLVSSNNLHVKKTNKHSTNSILYSVQA